MKRIVLIGASGHGKVCAEIAELSNKYSELLFLDDDQSIKKNGKYDVVGTSEDIYKYIDSETDFFVSIGNHKYRREIQQKIEERGGRIASLIHPNAVISEDVKIGIGTVIMPGSVINAGTIIGKGVIVNTSSSIDHDCSIGAWSHVAVGAHLCGTVDIGQRCWIGAGAVVSNNLSICADVVIGVGAVVVETIDEKGTYMGVPARKNR